jgi:glycosyltransferase involved in cell wall biosynthesis
LRHDKLSTDYPIFPIRYRWNRGWHQQTTFANDAWEFALAQQMFSDWAVAGRIKVAPAFTQDQVDDFFDTRDVLLFPSKWKESFGLVVAEALARDVWVVVTEGVGATEFVVHGENGTIIPLANDPRLLRDAFVGLLSDWRRLSVHVNTHKGLLRTYDMQADKLVEMLSCACGRATRSASAFLLQRRCRGM